MMVLLNRKINLSTPLFVTCACFLAFISDVPAQECKLYDATLYNNKPAPESLSAQGLFPIRVIYEGAFRLPADGSLPSEDLVRALATGINSNSTTDNLVIADIESWLRMDRTNAAQKYGKVADWLKNERSDLDFGFYSVPPRRDYWAPNGAGSYTSWQGANDDWAAIVDHVDAIYPSLYTFYDDQEGWVEYAKANIEEAQRVGQGKPILPFLWMRYHPGGNPELKWSQIPRDYWRLQLETLVEAGVNGIVIWGGWLKTRDYTGPEEWDGHAEWWQETTKFLKDVCGYNSEDSTN